MRLNIRSSLPTPQGCSACTARRTFGTRVFAPIDSLRSRLSATLEANPYPFVQSNICTTKHSATYLRYWPLPACTIRPICFNSFLLLTVVLAASPSDAHVGDNRMTNLLIIAKSFSSFPSTGKIISNARHGRVCMYALLVRQDGGHQSSNKERIRRPHGQHRNLEVTRRRGAL